MFRKVLLTLAAVAVVGAAAFTATTFATSPAGAAPYNYHRHHVWRPAVRFFAAPAYNSCYVRRVVPTPFGPRVEWVNVCY
jgi:hypothetical protein